MADPRLLHGVSLAFNGDLDRVEEWLDANCVGNFHFEFDGLKEDEAGLNQLRNLFKFERNEDKDRFKQVVTDDMFIDH